MSPVNTSPPPVVSTLTSRGQQSAGCSASDLAGGRVTGISQPSGFLPEGSGQSRRCSDRAEMAVRLVVAGDDLVTTHRVGYTGSGAGFG